MFCFNEDSENVCSILNRDGGSICLWDGHFPLRLQKKLSRKKLRLLSYDFSSALADLGIKFGESVALLLPNFPEFAVAYFGILRSGCVAAPINIKLSDFEIENALRNFDVRHVIALDKFYPLLSKIDILRNIIVLRVPDALPVVKSFGYRLKAQESNRIDISKNDKRVCDFYDFLKKGQGSFSGSYLRVRQKDDALILFTSGTTGSPKGVMHTHESLLENAYACKQLLCELTGSKNNEKEVFLAMAPYFHIMGISTMLHLPLLTGSKILTTFPFPGEDLGKKLINAIGCAKASIFVGAPRFYEMMSASYREGHNVSSLKICISGSDKIRDDVRVRFEKTFGVKILEGYGMSESGITHCQKEGFDFEGSVGIPFLGTEHKLIDVDKDRVGEVLVRGKGLMKCYKNASANEEVFIDSEGWLHTGDFGEIAKNGELFLTGRKKDLIKGPDGENIYPSQVEQVVSSHCIVKESAVVGRKTDVGVLVVAFVVLKDFLDAKSKEEIRAELFELCKKQLSSIKVPKEINFIVELPKNILGKVLKKDLR